MTKLPLHLFAIAALLAAGCATHSSRQATPVDRPATVESSTGSAAKTPSPNPDPAPDLASNPPSAKPQIKPALPTIFVASDSTAAHSSATNYQGWAMPFAEYFDPTKVNVVNRARGGRSSRTFVTEGLWAQLLADLKSNDIVLIQFGHNDGGPINDERRARGSLPGLGEETEEINNLMTGKHEVVHTFGWYVRKMIADAKAKGAQPILLSLTVRNIWKDGQIERGSGRYGQWLQETAQQTGVPFIDLTEKAANKLQPMGEEKVSLLYPRDHTHFNAEGATLHAEMVVVGLNDLPSHPVQPYLSAKGKALATVSEQPKRRIPRVGPVHAGFNPSLPTLWLIGDSTVKNGWDKGDGNMWGWGNPIAAYFDRSKINVENQALGGTSSRSYRTAGLWEAVRVQIKPGDFVIMQFGHNDGGGAYDDDRARKSIPGNGDESLKVTLQDGTTEIVHSYGWYLRQYIQDIKAAGATSIVCSLIPRNDWKDGMVRRSTDSYGQWAEAAAHEGGAFFINLNGLIADRYDQLGAAAVKPLFPNEHTHTSWDGAVLNAECVVTGIKGLDNCPLRNDLLPDPQTPTEP